MHNVVRYQKNEKGDGSEGGRKQSYTVYNGRCYFPALKLEMTLGAAFRLSLEDVYKSLAKSCCLAFSGTFLGVSLRGRVRVDNWVATSVSEPFGASASLRRVRGSERVWRYLFRNRLRG